jgi:hypothetical protein
LFFIRRLAINMLKVKTLLLFIPTNMTTHASKFEHLNSLKFTLAIVPASNVGNPALIDEFVLFIRATRYETRGWKIQTHCGSPKNDLWVEGEFGCTGARAPEIVGGESGSEKGV